MKAKEYIFSIVIDAGFMACWYFGITLGDERLINIPIFYMWFTAIHGIFSIIAINEKGDDIYKDRQYVNFASYFGDMALILIAVFYGWFITAAFYAVIAFIINVLRYDAVQKLKESEK